MSRVFKKSIIEVAYKGSTTDVQILFSTSGIEAANDIIQFCKLNQCHPILSMTSHLDEAHIMRISIPNQIITSTDILDDLVMEQDYQDILFGNKKLSDYKNKTIVELNNEEEMYYCRNDGSCYGHPTIAVETFNEKQGYSTEEIIGYRVYNDGMCKNIIF